MINAIVGIFVLILVFGMAIWLAEKLADLMIGMVLLAGIGLILLASSQPRSDLATTAILGAILGLVAALITFPLWPISSILKDESKKGGRPSDWDDLLMRFRLLVDSHVDLTRRISYLEEELGVKTRSTTPISEKNTKPLLPTASTPSSTTKSVSSNQAASSSETIAAVHDTIRTEGAWLYRLAGTDQAHTVSSGTRVKIIARDHSGHWLQVEMEYGKYWISREDVETSAFIDRLPIQH